MTSGTIRLMTNPPPSGQYPNPQQGSTGQYPNQPQAPGPHPNPQIPGQWAGPQGQPMPGQQWAGPQGPQPGQYSAPNYAMPYAQPPKKRRVWPWVVGGVVLLLILISAIAGGGGSDKGGSSDTAGSTQANNSADGANDTTAQAESDGKVAGLNTPVRDGKFEFTVTGVQPGLATVGDNEFLAQEAQGQFVIVSVTVKNIGDKAQGFSPSNQRLFDSQGRSFESNSSAQIALDETDIAVWDNINPGNAVDVKLVYDMPKDATPAEIELHDSMFSGGAKVSLKQG